MEIIIDDSLVLERKGVAVNCDRCQHRDFNTLHGCIAFPTEIPLEIWNGDITHTEVLPQQSRDVVFTPVVVRTLKNQ